MMTLLVAVAGIAGQNPPHVVAAQPYSIGVSKVDVTPSHPVRLHGFGFRRAESEGVKQRIWVKAFAIGEKDPFVLITADSLGVPRWMTDAVAEKLAARGVSKDRFCVCATHTHTAPMLVGIAPTIFGMDLPPDHQAHIEQYTREFQDALIRAAEAALADRKPRTLSWGVGSYRLAINRRTKGGPVDHDLAAMFIKEMDGKVRATFSNYACHCVTLSFNQISGDWAGCAAETLENMFPDSIALIAVGCGADSNPSSGVTGGKWEIAEQQGREFAAEVQRLSRGFLAPVFGAMSTDCKRTSLPLADLPTGEDWAKKANKNDAVGHHARVQQKRLADKKKLKDAVDYEVCVWKWGDQLAMAFLPGEVVVDYSLRLKKELDGKRLWINAYANDDPCYIPSERVLKEGGYEGEFAMVYYDLPTKFKPGLEAVIVAMVKESAGPNYLAQFDAKKTLTLPSSPQQSRSAFRLGDDLAVDLVAAEPLVVDPVAIAFGSDGKLWVAEMNDYPSGRPPQEPGGRVRFLEDRDGDGVFDASTEFLTGIPYPTGVTVWRNGVLVCAAPDILYAEDTNRDGKADVVRKVFSGFATTNFQARVNSLEYGLDGWLYGSCGLLGGDIKNERGDVVRLGHRDFRCKPDEGIIEPTAGSSQQGRVRNDLGDWFGCDNTNLAWHFPLPAEVLGRNPHVASPLNRINIPDGPASKIIPASNLQMFALSGPVGNATAACGIGVYRDSKLGSQFHGDFFTCEPVHNAVHRMKLERHGSTYIGRRPAEETNREFLASADAWCRPVQVRTGTDGSLWVVDMYRYVIEHPMWIPPEEHAGHDLRAGSTMGRIYRVRSAKTPPTALPKWNASEAASRIATDNGAVRDLAMQQILWTGDKKAAETLSKLALETRSPLQRLQAICTLDALGEVDALRRIIMARLSDPLDSQTIRVLGTRFANDPIVCDVLMKSTSAESSENRVWSDRSALAIALGNIKGDAAAETLIRLAIRKDADQFLRAAVLGSVNADSVVAAVKSALRLNAPPDVVKPLVASAVGFGKELQLDFLGKLNASSSPAAFAALEGLLQGLNRKKGSAAFSPQLSEAIDYAVACVVDSNANVDRRMSCLRLFGWLRSTNERESAALAKLLDQEIAPSIQSAAIETAGRLSSATAFKAMVRNWSRFSPTQRRAAIDMLLQTNQGSSLLVASLESKAIPATDLDALGRGKLLQHGDSALRERAARLFAPLLKNREAVIESYKEVENRPGDAERGKVVFGKNCAGCHRLDDAGFIVGPDLATVALKPASYLLMEILDPNRNLDARYVGYTVLAADGRTLTGLLAGESHSSLTLLGQDGRKMELLRSEIERIAASGKSLMPEGLEQQIPPSQMADLLAYVRRRLPPPKTFLGNTPRPIALQDGRYSLHARFAELRGPRIQFVVPQFALEFWESMEDFAAWELEVAKSGKFLIELEYGCPPNAAGNSFVLESDGKSIQGKTTSTGGWEQYKKVVIGEIELGGGRRRLSLKPAGEKLKGALFDLRAVYLTPK